MSRRTKQENEAIAERAQQILAEKAQRRRRPKAAAEAVDSGQEATEKPKRAKKERPPKERKPRVHGDLLTIAFRGPLAGHFRELADRHHLSLAGLLQDAVLSWESSVSAGYQPGTALAQWKAAQIQGSSDGA
jgi:hypothetical protein